MANTAKWVGGANPPGTPLSVLTTELNALANNTATVASAAVDNSANLDVYCDVWIRLASLSPAAGAYLTLYLLEAMDGSTYPSATGAALRNQPTQVLCVVPLDTTAATAQDLVIRNIPLPPSKFKLVLDNQAGVALGATLNTVKVITYNVNLNG